MYEAAELGFSVMIMVGLGSLIIAVNDSKIMRLLGLGVCGLIVGTGISHIIGSLKVTFF